MAHNRLLRAIAAQPWAMSADYVDAMLGVLEFRLQNGKLTAEQVDARLNGRREKAVAQSAGNIAVIGIRGVISNRASMIEDISASGGASAERIESQVRAAMEDEAVKALVLDIDSPGGAVGGTPELAATIREYQGGRKPIIAQINDLGASAAYWIASAADEIVAVPSAQVGSIGVISVHEEISRLLESEGITETIIASTPYKGEGNPFEPLGDEAREHIQGVVDRYHQMFVSAVAEGRGVNKDKVNADYGQGRTMIAEQARRAGMIDRVGTMRETLERLGAYKDDKPKSGTRAGGPFVSTAIAGRRLKLEREKARL